MKYYKLLFISLFIMDLTFAQSDSSNVFPPVDSSGIRNTDISVKDTISAFPDVDEINKLFLLTTQRRRDPFRIIPLVASRKDNAIPALQEFLFQPTSPVQRVLSDTVKDITSAGITNPNKAYAVYALDAIGTQRAEQLLILAAKTHPDNEIRSLALKTLAWNFYYHTKADDISSGAKKLIPDKEVVHLFLQNADDTTYAPNCNEVIGQIAREGILNWTDKDFCDILPDTLRIKTEKRLGMTLKEYREEWWQKNSNAVTWDKFKGTFLMK